MEIKTNELICLTDEQMVLVEQMESLYQKMQEVGIDFALNGDSTLVAYNNRHIAECEYQDETGELEQVEIDDMHPLFPVWAFGELYIKVKP